MSGSKEIDAVIRALPLLPPNGFRDPVKKPKKVRENKVESAHKKRVEATGGISRKFVSPGHRGVPDRIDLHGTKPMFDILREHLQYDPPALVRALCVELLAAAITFTECKKPGEVPTAEQAREHKKYRELGFTVNVVDTP